MGIINDNSTLISENAWTQVFAVVQHRFVICVSGKLSVLLPLIKISCILNLPHVIYPSCVNFRNKSG
jgi:hypothetical protein